MILNLASCDKEPFHQYKNAVIALDISELTFEATKKNYLAAYDRIHHLVDCTRAIAKSSSDQSRIQLIEEDIQHTLETSDDRHAFYVGTDFFWAIERLAKISLKAMTGEKTQFELSLIEALHCWVYLNTQRQLLPLDYYIDSSNRLALSLGQQHSTSGLRRLTYFEDHTLKQALNTLLSSQTTQDDFLALYKTRERSKTLEMMRTENLEEKRQHFREMIDLFKNDIRKILTFALDQNFSNYILWLEDPTLRERVGMEFDHESESLPNASA